MQWSVGIGRDSKVEPSADPSFFRTQAMPRASIVAPQFLDSEECTTVLGFRFTVFRP